MRRDLEALLFASDQPLTLDRLSGLFPDVERKAVREAVEGLRDEYDREERAFGIVEFGGGYSISTRPEFAPLVRSLHRGRRKARLSKAGLEVLAIISYKQPVTRLEIEDIRGVAASGVLSTLLERELISIVGRADSLGNPLLYGTTKAFLDHLGLSRLKDLPQLSELESLLEEKEQIKQMASRYQGRLSEEDVEAELELTAARARGEIVDEPVAEASEEAIEADDPDFDRDPDEPALESLEAAEGQPAATVDEHPN